MEDREGDMIFKCEKCEEIAIQKLACMMEEKLKSNK